MCTRLLDVFQNVEDVLHIVETVRIILPMIIFSISSYGMWTFGQNEFNLPSQTFFDDKLVLFCQNSEIHDVTGSQRSFLDRILISFLCSTAKFKRAAGSKSSTIYSSFM